jgi:hypothetical protein
VFGDAGGYFDGTSGYLSTPDHSDWDIFATTTEDWTMDCWVKLEDDTTEYLVTQWSAATSFWRWYKTSAPQGLFFSLTVGGSNLIVLDSKTAMGDNTWHHVVFLKRGTEYALYVDGIQKAYDTSASTANFTNPLQIGAINGGGFLTGYMDDLRIIQSNAFSTYPVPEPALHYKLNDDLATTAVIDTGSLGINGTSVGGNTNTMHVPGKIGGAFDFDGSSDYVNISSAVSSVRTDTTGTLSFWMNTDTWTGSPRPFSMSNFASQRTRTLVELDTGFKLNFYVINDNTTLTHARTTTNMTTSAWHHIAIVQDGTAVKLYLDGVDDTNLLTGGTHWYNDATTHTQDTMLIAAGTGISTFAQHYDGTLDDFRMYSTEALTSNQIAEIYHGGRGTEEVFAGKLTVPTSAHTPDGDTRLLLDFDGNIEDESNHEVTAVGPPTINTGTKQWGAGSALFVATNNDHLELPDHPEWDIIGDTTTSYTVDTWFKFASTSTNQTIWSQDADINNFFFFVNRGSSGDWFGFRAFVAGVKVVDVTTTTVISDTNWHHVALVKLGSDWSLLLDGVEVAYDNFSTTGTYTSDFHIGDFSFDGTSNFDGYLDDFRITQSNAFDVPLYPSNLLLIGEGVDEATSITNDATLSTASTPTMNSGCKLDSADTKYNATTSIFFDGANDYIDVIDSTGTDFDFFNTSADWTLDLWVKHVDHAGDEWYR